MSAWIEWLHQQLLFPAPKVAMEDIVSLAPRLGAEILSVETSDGLQLLGWYRPSRGERLVLFMHGNSETVVDRVDLQDVLVAQGIDFLVVAYRGYPGSPGISSEVGLKADVMAAWQYATEQLGFPASKIVLHGKSLGGGAVGLLCDEVQPAAVILESTFLSVPEVVSDRSPHPKVVAMVKERFDTSSRAASIRCPVLVLHGDQDRVIPVRHGRELWPKFANATYIELSGAAHGESLTVVEPAAREAYLTFLSAAFSSEAAS